jgi:hypothetical protein
MFKAFKTIFGGCPARSAARLLLALCLIGMASANADTVFNVVGGTLSDGSTFSGTVTIDTTSSGKATAVDITITGATSYHATKVIFDGGFGSIYYMGLSDGANNNTYLELTIVTGSSTAIGYAGGPIDIPLESKFVLNANYGAGPFVTAGSFVPCGLTFSKVAASPNVLWPPNHKMVPVTVTPTASSTCGTASCQITLVTSNEPLDPDGDWVVTPGSLTLQLRAERLGSGTGRIYTITVQCSDGTSTPISKTVTVTVPHDQGH